MATRVIFQIGESKVEGELIPVSAPPVTEQNPNDFYSQLTKNYNQPFHDEIVVKLNSQYYVARLWQSPVVYQELEGKSIKATEINEEFEVIKILQDEPNQAYPIKHIEFNYVFFTTEGILVPTTPKEHGISNPTQFKNDVLGFFGIKEGDRLNLKQVSQFYDPKIIPAIIEKFGLTVTDFRFAIEWDEINSTLNFKMFIIPLAQKLKVELASITGEPLAEEEKKQIEALVEKLVQPPFHHENVQRGLFQLELAMRENPNFMFNPHRKTVSESISIGHSPEKELVLHLNLMRVPQEQWIDLTYFDAEGRPLKSEKVLITSLLPESKLALPLSRVNVINNIEQLRVQLIEKGFIATRKSNDTTSLELHPVPTQVKFETNIPFEASKKELLFKDASSNTVTGPSLQSGMEQLVKICLERGYQLRQGEPKWEYTPQGLIIEAHAQTLDEIQIILTRPDGAEEIINPYENRKQFNFLKEFEQKPGELLDILALERALYKIKSRYPILLNRDPTLPYFIKLINKPDHVQVIIPLDDVQPAFTVGLRGSAAPTENTLKKWMGSAQARYTHRNFEGEQLGIEVGWAGAGEGQQFSVGGFWDIPWLNNEGLGLTLSSGFTHHNHYGENISAAAQLHIPMGGPHSRWLFSPGLRTSLLLDNNQTSSLRLQPSVGFQYDYPGRTKLSLQGGPSIDSSGRVFFEAMAEGLHKFFLSKNQKLHLDISGNAGAKVGNVPELDLFRSALVLQDYGGPIPDLNLAHAGAGLNLVLEINEWLSIGAGLSASIRKLVTGSDGNNYQTEDRLRAGAGVLVDLKIPYLGVIRIMPGVATEDGKNITPGITLGIPF